MNLTSAAFTSILVHPVSNKPLIANASGTELTDPESGEVFEVHGGVYNLLPKRSGVQLKMFDYQEHYQQDSLVYDYFDMPGGKTEVEERRRLHQYILSKVPSAKGWVLDMGCGGGWLSQSLVPNGYAVISADISDVNPAKAIQQLPAPNHVALVADANFLPLANGSVDCIVASEIIEHVPDPRQFTASLYVALKPGGRLIITTPYNEFIRYSLCIHCNRNTPHNAHLHSFTETSILEFMPKDAKVETTVFGSKILSSLRLLRVFKILPYALYRMLDKALTVMSGKKAARLMVVIQKA